MYNSVQGTHWGGVSDCVSVVDCHGFVVRGEKIHNKPDLMHVQ